MKRSMVPIAFPWIVIGSRRWPVHPAWVVVQGAFSEETDPGLGPLVRKRIREKNVERGIAATIGYISTLAAWLGGEYTSQDADVSLMLHWLSEVGPGYNDGPWPNESL